jgi:predicted membrane protein|tara:strand:- start:141 stop:638 length:498 start_codon:yes stop_codon:yes gene_type:complete
MPQFVVPQFIDVEDKIIGPITVRQFIMGIVVMMFIFVAYKFADTALFIIEALLLFGLYLLVAFIKINGQHSYIFVLNIVKTLTRPGLRIWMKKPVIRQKPSAKKEIKEEDVPLPPMPRKIASQHALSSLALLVDTGGKYRPEDVLKNVKPKTQSSKKEPKTNSKP